MANKISTLKPNHLRKIEKIVYEVLRELSHENDRAKLKLTDENFLKLFDHQFLKKLFSNFSLKIFEKENYDNNQFRLFLREHLVDEIENHFYIDLNDIEKNHLLNLNETPACQYFLSEKEVYCSITHSPTYGGVALCQTPVGLDTEHLNRCDLKILKRVSSDLELSFMPSAAHLWSAKEATFKCLTQTPYSIKVVAEAVIQNWHSLFYDKNKIEIFTLNSDSFTQFNTHYHFIGLSMVDNEHVFSFCFAMKK